MNTDRTKTLPAAPSRTWNKKPIVPFTLCFLWLAWSTTFVISDKSHYHSPWPIVLLLVLCIVLAILSIDPKTAFGEIEHVQIDSPPFVERIRKHYQSQGDQLAALGFDNLFYFGEAVSIFRVFLGLPAIIFVHMWLDKVPMTFYKGSKILSGNPVYGSKDNVAYAHPNSFGITFHTAFRDHTILLTRDHEDNSRYPPSVVVHAQRTGLVESWNQHKESIKTFESEANPVDRQNGFQFYSEVVRKEAPLG